MASIGLTVVTIVFAILALRSSGVAGKAILAALWGVYAAVDLVTLGVIL